MALTTAPTGIYIGGALGVVAGLATQNWVVGIVVAVVASIASWYGIRAVEKLLGRGLDAGIAAFSNRYRAPASPPRYPQPSPQQWAHDQQMAQPAWHALSPQQPTGLLSAHDPQTQPMRLRPNAQSPLPQQNPGWTSNEQRQYPAVPYLPPAQAYPNRWPSSPSPRGIPRFSELRPHHVAEILAAVFAFSAIAFITFRGVTTTTEYNLETGATTTSSNLGSLIVVVALLLLLTAACFVAARILRPRNADGSSSAGGPLTQNPLLTQNPPQRMHGEWANQWAPWNGGTHQRGESAPPIDGVQGMSWHRDEPPHLHSENRSHAAAHFNGEGHEQTAQWRRPKGTHSPGADRGQTPDHTDTHYGVPTSERSHR